MVGKARHQFANVELALRPQCASVERGRNIFDGHFLVTMTIVVHLRFLHLEMKMQPLRSRMRKHDVPLIQLRAIVVHLLVSIDERPDVVSVASRIVGEEREGIHSLIGKVVQRTDQRLPFAIVPRGITLFPISGMGFPGLERSLFRIVCLGSIEVGVGKKRFRRVRSCLEKAGFIPRELQVSLANVVEAPTGTEIGSRFVRRRNGK